MRSFKFFEAAIANALPTLKRRAVSSIQSSRMLCIRRFPSGQGKRLTRNLPELTAIFVRRLVLKLLEFQV